MKPWMMSLAAAVILSGCAPHIAGIERPPAPLVPPDVYYDTQAVVGPCDASAESVVILSAIAAAVIAQGVNRIGDAIKAAGETETTVVTANRNIEINQRGLGPCVTVVRGWFYRAPPSYDPASPFSFNPKSHWPHEQAAEIQAYWRAGLFLASTPDFYFQGRIVSSTDKTSYTVLPVQASLDKPISSTMLRGGARSILVSFAFTEAGKPADLQKGGGSTIVLGRMEPGELITFSSANCFASGTGGELTPTHPIGKCPDAGKFDTLIRSPFESEWFSVLLSDKSKPMTLQALVSETRSPSQFLAFVGDVFGATKSQLTDKLQRELIPSVGDDAAEADLSAKEKLDNEADAAQGKAITDLKNCVATPADAAKRLTARSSLRSYIQAARKAKRPSKVTTALIEAIMPSESTTAACQNALSTLASDL